MGLYHSLPSLNHLGILQMSCNILIVGSLITWIFLKEFLILISNIFQSYMARSSFFSKDCFCTAKGSCHIVFRSPFRYAIKNNGDKVNGTKYKSAGWAALKT